VTANLVSGGAVRPMALAHVAVGAIATGDVAPRVTPVVAAPAVAAGRLPTASARNGWFDGGDPLPIFSRFAPWMIAVLVVGGLALLLIQAGVPPPLVTT